MAEEKIIDLIIGNLEKYVVPKGGTSYKNEGCDFKMSKGTAKNGSNHINFVFYDDFFKLYKYITFYVAKGRLILKVSNDLEENSYTISKSRNTMAAKVSGKAYEILLPFCGNYSTRIHTAASNGTYLYTQRKS